MKNSNYKVKKYIPSDTNSEAIVCVPGSKSITNRALLIAAMADGKSILKNVQQSEDSKYFLQALKTLGFDLNEYTDNNTTDITVEIQGSDGSIPEKKAEIYVGSAGTAARFLCAMLAFSDGEYVINASEQMCKRPMQPLIDSLRELGADITCHGIEGHLPLSIVGARKTKHLPKEITVDISKSSQFLSALLIAASASGAGMKIKTIGDHGLDYVHMTVKMAASFGVQIDKTDSSDTFIIPEGSKLKGCQYLIEPDMSAACYFFSMAALTKKTITVKNTVTDSLQGDVRFLEILEKMGVTYEDTAQGIRVTGNNNKKLTGGFDADLHTFSDQALTLAAIAPFADAPITISGISHIRLQECDRMNAIAVNLTKMGICCEKTSDSVTIYPGTPAPAEIETFEDHRVAMSFALTGLLSDGIIIKDPSCCKKTFANYFEVFEDALQQLQ